MTIELTYSIDTTRFDEDYAPATGSRATTNFANLARGEDRRDNLRGVLAMIDARANELAGTSGRYGVELDIVSADLHLGAEGGAGVPLIEVLDVTIVDRETGERTPGITGNNFSSYVRDYDFSVLLPAQENGIPADFGELHGKLFRHFVASDAYGERFAQPPVICISVSTSRTYRRTGFEHPILGVEFRQDDDSLTDRYFAKMGLAARYFMPRGSAAPLAFYFEGDLTSDHSDLALIGTIATMEAFQWIYRPEIYGARTAAGDVFRPSLEHADFDRPGIDYDREERSRLGRTQGLYTEEHFMTPYGSALAEWAATR
ncbi:putative oxygenase MesX [Microbacterium indicum]|uniref:putative oxygenase MesX n=1 Tax=Microbacterium indicum TaxID=358100 RepID=UPI0004255258|nr:putative oxygenase MesX [Microbacterium indicum]